MKRVICLSVMAVLLWATAALAVNTVVIPSMSVDKGQTGVVIPILLTNDVQLKSVICPVVFREQTPGAFITSVTLAFADRLPPGSPNPLNEISFRNQYAEEDGVCKDAQPGGFGTITSSSGGPSPVVASPECALFVRQKLFSPALAPGSDATGSFVMTVDVTNVDGTFLIDTTCANPSNHLLFIEDITNTPYIPDFTPSVITVGSGGSVNQPPLAVCQDVTVSADALCQAAVAADQIDNGSSDPDSDPITLALDPPGPYGLGNTPVNLIVTDDKGDADTCAATITVIDDLPPAITSCPGDISVQCAADIPTPNPGIITATDNCGTPTVTHVGDESDGASCPETITRIYRATDGSGNFVECTQIITVDDTEIPVLSNCPSDIQVQCLSEVPAPAEVSATDNCDGLTLDFTEVDNATGNPCGGTIVRTWTATDVCGNTDECTQTITVNDTEPPTVTCSGDIEVTIGPGETEAVVEFTPTVVDNCGSATVSCVPPSGSSFPVGATSVTCTGVDQCGNSSECSFVVDVTVASLPPVAICQNVVVDADANCEADASVDDGSNDPDGGTVTLSQDPPGPYPLGVTNVVLTVTDDEGDVATCDATVTVEDHTPPVISCPADIAVDVGAGETGANVEFVSTADDNCSVPVVDCDHVSGEFFPVGATVVTCTATDDAGNSASCSFTITITETGPNASPVAVDDYKYTRGGAVLKVVGAGVLANDYDPDGDPLTAILDTDVGVGTLTLNPDGSYDYYAPIEYVGPVEFTYYANDGLVNSISPATVYITVRPNMFQVADFDQDGFITALDVAAEIDALFAGGLNPRSTACDATCADFDCDGQANTLDLGQLIDHVYGGGPGPCDPCGQ